ncbi:helix-turn-helix domain-containing protein [Bartonella sp. WD12.1]|uniref:helix-turn-helix domain-containing protein n=1 Tax=Bartonella sp. WD12.1 TaxID=1933903 RepID=UPI00099A60AE|nr:helix-turn-helix domain-containing protein [Bartonella sp. WD12.1]
MITENKLEIKSIRKCLAITQRELADILGVKQASVCRWEKGKGLSLRNYFKLRQLQDSLVPPTSAFLESSTINEHQQDNSSYQREERL